eukprot:Nk52_evm8s250 gene=Nk52_evmTU8s250
MMNRFSTVSDWLESIKLPQYVNVFLDNGYEDMDYLITDFSSEDLVELDITLPGHKKKIMSSLTRLNKASNSSSSAEVTANEDVSVATNSNKSEPVEKDGIIGKGPEVEQLTKETSVEEEQGSSNDEVVQKEQASEPGEDVSSSAPVDADSERLSALLQTSNLKDLTMILDKLSMLTSSVKDSACPSQENLSNPEANKDEKSQIDQSRVSNILDEEKKREDSLVENYGEVTETKKKLTLKRVKAAIRKVSDLQIPGQVIVKVFDESGNAKTVLIDPSMKARAVVHMLISKNHICDEGKVFDYTPWCLVERISDLGVERPFEDHEIVVDVVSKWTQNSPNILILKNLPERFTLFYPAKSWTKKVPKFCINAWFKDGKAKSWRKRKFMIVNKSVYYSTEPDSVKDVANLSKGSDVASDPVLDSGSKSDDLNNETGGQGPKGHSHKPSNSSECSAFDLTENDVMCSEYSLEFYCSLEEVNMFTSVLVAKVSKEQGEISKFTQAKKRMKAPTGNIVALKPLLFPSYDRIKFLCFESKDQLDTWLCCARIAKYGEQIGINLKHFDKSECMPIEPSDMDGECQVEGAVRKNRDSVDSAKTNSTTSISLAQIGDCIDEISAENAKDKETKSDECNDSSRTPNDPEKGKSRLNIKMKMLKILSSGKANLTDKLTRHGSNSNLLEESSAISDVDVSDGQQISKTEGKGIQKEDRKKKSLSTEDIEVMHPYKEVSQSAPEVGVASTYPLTTVQKPKRPPRLPPKSLKPSLQESTSTVRDTETSYDHLFEGAEEIKPKGNPITAAIASVKLAPKRPPPPLAKRNTNLQENSDVFPVKRPIVPPRPDKPSSRSHSIQSSRESLESSLPLPLGVDPRHKRTESNDSTGSGVNRDVPTKPLPSKPLFVSGVLGFTPPDSPCSKYHQPAKSLPPVPPPVGAKPPLQSKNGNGRTLSDSSVTGSEEGLTCYRDEDDQYSEEVSSYLYRPAPPPKRIFLPVEPATISTSNSISEDEEPVPLQSPIPVRRNLSNRPLGHNIGYF